MALRELNLQTYNYTAYEYVGDGRDTYDFDAPYQRGVSWFVEDKRNLVRSMLMRLPIGVIVVSKLPYDREKFYRVVDGKQRILAIRAFVAGEFSVPADWFHPVDLAGTDDRWVVWNDLSPRGQRGFLNCGVATVQFDPTKSSYRDADGNWQHEEVGEDEWIRAEAEVFLLINAAGRSQDDATIARAAEIRKG